MPKSGCKPYGDGKTSIINIIPLFEQTAFLKEVTMDLKVRLDYLEPNNLTRMVDISNLEAIHALLFFYDKI